MFKEDPIQANLMLLFMDMADENGKFEIHGRTEKERDLELSILMNARFEDVMAYNL